MPTRSQSASTSLRMCEDRKTVWPRSRASAMLSRNACSISGSSPLVGSSSTSRSARVISARDQDDLLPVPLGVGPDLLGRDRARTGRSARPGRPRRPGPGRGPSRCRVSAPVSDGHRFASPGTKARRRWASTGWRWQSRPKISAAPRGRADQPEQQPDRGRLARAVGPEVTDHLALADLEVEVVEGGDGAVALRQALRAYGRVLPLTGHLRDPGLYKRIADYSHV